MVRPDPTAEIRLVSLRSLRRANFWSPRPVTRLDLVVGAFDEISSAQVPGFTDALLSAFPGLIEHRCSIGERGGFITRLRRGTYAPHIMEHIALELQSMIGHEVGYGRARGGDRPGEYTVVLEHLHAEVGLRAAALALEIVQHAFAGNLESVEYALAELRALAEAPDIAAPGQRVLCGITGGGPRAEVRRELTRRGLPPEDLVIDVSPGYILQVGLPYSRSEVAVILDAEPRDVPERYRDPERARQLVSVLADAVRENGVVVVPANERDVQERVQDAGCRIATFTVAGSKTGEDRHDVHATASVRESRIVVECRGTVQDGGALRPDGSARAQVAAALAHFSLGDRRPGIPGPAHGMGLQTHG